MTDASHWFLRRRGIAVAIASCGNYLSGTIWPPIIQHFISIDGWRTTQMWIGVLCVVTLIPLSLHVAPPRARRSIPPRPMPTRRASWERSASPRMRWMVLLFIAGIACCVAMAMPQVHIVAYCGDLGYGRPGAPRCCR